MSHLHRRSFVKLAAASAALDFLPLGRGAWAAGIGESDRRLVVIFLRGAVDGLSVVVPYRDAAYHAARPTIALEAGAKGVIDLDGNFGLHPALAPVMPLWQQGSLAFIHAAGSADPTRSHFDAQLIMEAGGSHLNDSGWLNRLLAALPGPKQPPPGVNFGAALPHIMSGPVEVATIDMRGNAARSPLFDDAEANAAFDRMYSGDDSLSRAYRDSKAAHRDLAAMAADNAMAKEQAVANNGAPLAEQAVAMANRLGRLLGEEPRFQVAFMAAGGWDTHVRQGNAEGQLAKRLGYLGDALAALMSGLGQSYRRTVIVLMSEFGRTVHENGDGGTDHGHGNAMWVLGGPVRGGKIYGTWPGLAPERLYQGRDLAITTDYRTVLGTVLHGHLKLAGDTIERILPGAPRPDADMVKLIRA